MIEQKAISQNLVSTICTESNPWSPLRWAIMTASFNEHAELIALLSAAYKQCLKLHKLFLQVAGAPHDLEILGRDLQDSYLILRTLYTLTSDEESPSHFIESAVSGNLRSVINDCLLILVDVSSILVEFQAGRRNSNQDWQDGNSTNKTSEIFLLHDNRRCILFRVIIS